jgi:2,3-bisphosphoglycerate-independent phosphoglycerate mutase
VARRRILFVFLDGVGIGVPDPDANPFFAASLPTLERVLGAVPSSEEPLVAGPVGRAFPLDATLGVEGRPQSGTGQHALLTGVNGAALIGRHFGPWTPSALRPSLERDNLFVTYKAGGRSVAFANAHPPGFTRSRWFKRPAPIPLAANAAGLMDRGIDELVRGTGLASDIENTRMAAVVDEALPSVTLEEAGRNLARLARGYDLTFFAHYSTDAAGHEGEMAGSVRALERVDAFLGGVLAERDPGVGVLVASDHGNVESVEAGHTRNPALGLWLPPAEWSGGASPGALPSTILEVKGWMEEWLRGG